jgi:hypothetical protein
MYGPRTRGIVAEPDIDLLLQLCGVVDVDINCSTGQAAACHQQRLVAQGWL